MKNHLKELSKIKDIYMGGHTGPYNNREEVERVIEETKSNAVLHVVEISNQFYIVFHIVCDFCSICELGTRDQQDMREFEKDWTPFNLDLLQ